MRQDAHVAWNPVRHPRPTALTGLAFALMVVCVGPDATAGPTIEPFGSDKALYELNAPVTFKAVVSDPDRTPGLRYRLTVQHGVAPVETVAQGTLVFPEGQQACSLEIPYFTGTHEYGHWARFDVLAKSGRVLASRACVYEACTDWRKVIRLAFLQANNVCAAARPSSHAVRLVARARQVGINTIEVSHLLNSLEPVPPPGQDIITFISGARRDRISRRNVMALVEACKRNGMRVIGYVLPPHCVEPPARHRLRFRADDEADWAAKMLFQPKYGTYLSNPLQVRDRFVARVGEMVRQFGFDGLWYDSFAQWLVQCATRFADSRGQKLTDMTVGELTEWFFVPSLRAAQQHNPDFVALVNNAAHFIIWPAGKSKPGDVLKIVMHNMDHIRYGNDPRNTLWKQAELFPVICTEAQAATHKAKYMHTYELMLNIARAVRKVTGKPFLCTGQFTLRADSDDSGQNSASYTKPYMATMFAAGALTAELSAMQTRGMVNTRGLSDDVPYRKAYIDYNRFAARYGQYIYDMKIDWANPAVLQVKAPRSIYWKDAVYVRRVDARHEELIVHLLNLPANHEILALPHKAPTPAAGVEVRFRLSRRGAWANPKAWLMSPDLPTSDPVPLVCKPVTKGKPDRHFREYNVTGLPSVPYWAMVVIGYERANE